MKILEDYKKVAQELLFEVDDEKIIKYKDKDGESAEMKAGSAKTMPDDHPAKQAYNKMKDDGGDDKEKPSGQKIGGSDFDRDAQNQKDADDWASKMFGAEKDKVTGKYGGESSKSGKPWKELEGDDTLKHLSKKDLNLTMQFMKGLPKFFTYGKLNNLTADDKGDIYYSNEKGLGYFKVGQVGDDTTLDDLRADIKKNVPLALKGKLGNPTELGKDDSPVGSNAPKKKEVEIPSGTMKPNEDGEDETAMEIADSLAKKYDISREYAMERAKEEIDSGKTYSEFAEDLEMDFESMSDEGGQQRYDEPMFDDEGMRKMKYGGDDGDEKSKMISKHGTNLPSGTDSNTKVSDLDEDEVEEFFNDVADEYSEEYDISRGVMADYSDQILRQAREEGESMGDLIDNIESAAQEAAEEGGYEEYEKEESVKPKKKPFLKEQLERFGGGRY